MSSYREIIVFTMATLIAFILIGLTMILVKTGSFVDSERFIMANLEDAKIFEKNYEPLSFKSLRPRLINMNVGDQQAISDHLQGQYGFTADKFCQSELMTSLSACIQFNKQPEMLEKLYSVIASQPIKGCSAGGNSSNAWLVAFAYDQLKAYAAQQQFDLSPIKQKLSDALAQCLTVLDGSSASLWHGRFSIGAQAFIIAMSIDEGELPDGLSRRAFEHFLRSVEALSVTEGWPEGYNYWIQNRGLPFFLAVSGYLRSFSQPDLQSLLLNLSKRVGLWHIYMTRPDDRIAPNGDEGSRTDLKEESKKVIDLIAKITKSPEIATYADYLQRLHNQSAYYASYYWMIPFFYDPNLELISTKEKGLNVFENWLPNQEVFGRGHYNQIVVRSGWDKDATFIQMRAGHKFSHHQHMEAGHFTLFKRLPIISDSSVYNGVATEHRKYYGVRSVAKNTVLVLRPGDTFQPNKLFDKAVNNGGQRLVMPTGGAVRSLEHWRANLYAGQHFEGGRLINFDANNEDYVFWELELARAYDSDAFDRYNQDGRVKSVKRQMLYLQNDKLLIRDSILKTDASFQSSIEFHTLMPSMNNDSRVIFGNFTDGVLATNSSEFRFADMSYFTIKRLLPDASRSLIYFGENHRFLVSQELGNGQTKMLNVPPKIKNNMLWYDKPAARISMQVSNESIKDIYLTLIDLTAEQNSVPNQTPITKDGVVDLGEYVVVFDQATVDLVELKKRLNYNGLRKVSQLSRNISLFKK